MSSDQGAITKVEIVARVRRFAALRAAQRALAPSVRAGESLAPMGPLRMIRDQLKDLLRRIDDAAKAQPPGAGPPTLASVDMRSIDEALDNDARRLRGVADAIPLPQFRASLPLPAHQQRDEVVALLDVLLEDVRGIPTRLSLIDYLITLLSIACNAGSWSVVVDPPNVSERTRQLSLNAPLCAPQIQDQILTRFHEASESLSAGGEFETVLKEMAAYKKKIVDYFFLPEILRCVVSYNLAVRVWNEERISKVREEHREVALDPAPTRAEGPPDLAAIESALAGRVTGAAPTAAGPAAAIAARLDLGALQEPDTPLLAHPDPDASMGLQRRIVVLGLLLQALPEIEPDLRHAGIDPKLLEEEWVRDLSDSVGARTNELIAANEYDAARQLSELQSRFLFSATVAARRKRAPEPRAAAPGASPIEPIHDMDEALTRARQGPRPPPRPRQARPLAREPRVSRRTHALAATFVLMLGAMTFNLLATDPTVKGMVSASRLSEISPLLESGYRTEEGQGHLFMGTLVGGWSQLDEAERKQIAAAVRDRLAREGVREVMLFDRRKALQVHYLGQRNEYPGWADSDSTPPAQDRAASAKVDERAS